jgi:hypothetical protein
MEIFKSSNKNKKKNLTSTSNMKWYKKLFKEKITNDGDYFLFTALLIVNY